MNLRTRLGRKVELPRPPLVDGVPADELSAHEAHERNLSAEADAARARAAAARGQVDQLDDEREALLLAGDVEGARRVAAERDEAHAAATRASAEADAIGSAATAVAAARQRLAHEQRADQLEALEASLNDEVATELAALPLLLAALQNRCRALLEVEGRLGAAAVEARTLRWHLAHPEGAPMPRISRPTPVSAFMEWHPQFRSFANGTTFIGQPDR